MSGWRHLSVFLRLSVLVHVMAVAAWIARPDWWPWALLALVANHAAIVAAGLLPRCSLLGPNHTRLPAAARARGEIALTIDDGPDPEVTPRVLDLLDRHGVKATFFCIGERATRHPGLCREIVRRGHAVENHSQHHRLNFSLRGYRYMVGELQAGQRTLQAITGIAPRFFRAPAGLRNPFLDPALRTAGLQLAAWTRRGYDTRERDPAVVLARLLRNLSAGDILLLHDGNAARDSRGAALIESVLPPLLDAVAARGLRPVTLSAAMPAGESC